MKDIETIDTSGVPPLADTEWLPLVDLERLDHRAVVDLLRQLALAAFSRLYADGPAVVVKPSEMAQLRPILGGRAWLRRRPALTLSYLKPVLQFRAKAHDFKNNDVALLLGTTVKRSGPLRRWLNHYRARRSPLIGSDGLFAAFRWVAWSDPRLNLQSIAMVRQAWRERTLFHPAEPEWPPCLHQDLILVIVRLALSEGMSNGQGYRTERAGQALRDALDAELRAAGMTLSKASQIEQLIAVDAYRKLAGSKDDDVDALMAQLPVANLSGVTETDGITSEDPEKKPPEEQARVAIEDFVVQFLKGTP